MMCDQVMGNGRRKNSERSGKYIMNFEAVNTLWFGNEGDVSAEQIFWWELTNVSACSLCKTGENCIKNERRTMR